MAGKFTKPRETRKKRKWWPWLVAGLCLLTVAAVLFFLRRDGAALSAPTLTVETPQKLSRAATEEFALKVTVSDLGEAAYPAASMTIAFDPSRLEFLGVEEGNVPVSDDATGQKLPEWSWNSDSANATGTINLMYLDMTGGRCAFRRALLPENERVVLRLRFRLRGSVAAGDVLDLTVQDAVFAASDETQSLAVTADSLKIRNSKVVIVE